MMPEITRRDPNIYWPCPFCNTKCGDWPIGAAAHLCSAHSVGDSNPISNIRALASPDYGDEEDVIGLRFHLHCPFCENGPATYASFKDKEALKSHLADVHGVMPLP